MHDHQSQTLYWWERLGEVVCAESQPLHLQDVIEELIGTEIVDETDQFVDNLRSEKVRPAVCTSIFLHTLGGLFSCDLKRTILRWKSCHPQMGRDCGPSLTQDTTSCLA